MCSDCVTLILFKEKEESSTIRLILIKCHKDYERSILYTYQALKSSLKVWQIYVLFPKCLPQSSQPWSVWSRKNILLDKFPLGIPTSGDLLSFFATLHKNAKNSFKGIQWWHCYCWAAESVEGPQNYRRWKISRGQCRLYQLFFIHIFSVWVQALHFFYIIPFVFLRQSTTEARLLKFNMSIATRTTNDLHAHLRAFSSSYCLQVF